MFVCMWQQIVVEVIHLHTQHKGQNYITQHERGYCDAEGKKIINTVGAKCLLNCGILERIVHPQFTTDFCINWLNEPVSLRILQMVIYQNHSLDTVI